MNSKPVLIAKVIVTGYWLLTGLAVMGLWEPAITLAAQWLASIVLAAHLLEFLLYLVKWRVPGRSLVKDWMGIMLYGGFHIFQIRQSSASNESSA